MKILIPILPVLFLEVLTSSGNTCQVQNGGFFYIYNTTATIPVYHCIYDVDPNFSCEQCLLLTVKDNPSNIKNQCELKRNSLSGNRRFDSQYEQANFILCKSLTRYTFLEETQNMTKTPFDNSADCRDVKNRMIDILIKDCGYVQLLYNNSFNVYSDDQNQTKYIRYGDRSLELLNPITLCGLEMWGTNYNDIVVSHSYMKTLISHNVLPNFRSALDQKCKTYFKYTAAESTNSTKISANYNLLGFDKSAKISATKTLYIYTYDIDVYHCTSNNSSCGNMTSYTGTIQDKTRLLNRCKIFFDKQITVDVCKQTLGVNLKENNLEGLPSDCKYDEGICNVTKSFWIYKKNCGATPKLYMEYEGDCMNENCVITISNSNKLVLLMTNNVCNETVWFTNTTEYVVSDKKLSVPDSTNKLYLKKDSELADNLEIEHSKRSLKYIICFIIICVLWYILNVMINLSTLWIASKQKGSKSKTHLIYCVSQSLTNRYLFSKATDNGNIKLEGKSQLPGSQGIYESVDN